MNRLQLFRQFFTVARVPRYCQVVAKGADTGAHGSISDDESEKYFANKFKCSEDGWDVRDVVNELNSEDRVPLPDTVIEGLKACRRVNDYALAIRFMESVKHKCTNRKDELWPYISVQIKPTLEQLGISSLEEMGYDKPELAVQNVEDMCAKKFTW